MGLLEDETNYNFKSAQQFSDELKTLQQQLPPILDDFEKYYVFYNMNPSNNEYQQLFQNIKNNLDSINSKIFILSNNIEKEIDNINKKLLSLDMLIRKEKEKNIDLKIKLGIIKEKEDSADVMISDYKQRYDIGYVKNWAVFLSIIIAGFAISKVSSNKISV
jgi:hypothetical protein